MVGFTYRKIWSALAFTIFVLVAAACGSNVTMTPTPLNPGLFPPPGTTGPNAHTPVVTPLSDGAAGPVTLPAGSATAKPLDNSSLGTSAVQPLMSPTPGTSTGTTPAAASNSCVTPTGWVAYTVQVGDTLSTLATAHAITV